jgi:hypothetical protein
MIKNKCSKNDENRENARNDLLVIQSLPIVNEDSVG